MDRFLGEEEEGDFLGKFIFKVDCWTNMNRLASRHSITPQSKMLSQRELDWDLWLDQQSG